MATRAHVTSDFPIGPSDMLVPERDASFGPITLRRLRRSAVGYVALGTIGLVFALTDVPGWMQVAGLGLLWPGAGFVATSLWYLVPIVLILFAMSGVLWFGSGNIVAPALVWA